VFAFALTLTLFKVVPPELKLLCLTLLTFQTYHIFWQKSRTNSALTSIDVSKNLALENLHMEGNHLMSLDLSNNSALKLLDCRRNSLSSLDVSNNTALVYLFCDQNQITSLNLSNNILLKGINCYENQLTSLNLSNIVSLSWISCEKNPLLNCIQVSNVNNISFTYYIDEWASFSEDCGI
jgi:hypothetical protein